MQYKTNLASAPNSIYCTPPSHSSKFLYDFTNVDPNVHFSFDPQNTTCITRPFVSISWNQMFRFKILQVSNRWCEVVLDSIIITFPFHHFIFINSVQRFATLVDSKELAIDLYEKEKKIGKKKREPVPVSFYLLFSMS